MSFVDRFRASVSTLAVSRARVRRGGVSPPLTELDSSRHFFRVRSSIPGFCVGGMFQSSIRSYRLRLRARGSARGSIVEILDVVLQIVEFVQRVEREWLVGGFGGGGGSVDDVSHARGEHVRTRRGSLRRNR